MLKRKSIQGIYMETTKRILVIGGAGFVGSNLIKKLLEQGHDVISMDNYSTGSHDNEHKGCHYYFGTPKDLLPALENHHKKLDYIFHLGEYARVEQSFEDYDKVMEYNHECFPYVLEFAKQQDAKLIYSGSSTKFAEGGGKSMSPYAYTKAQNTELLQRYSEWFELDYAIVYFYNVYGDNEIGSGKYATVVAKFLNMVKEGQKILPVTSPGTQLRNFTHINDIIDGLILAGFKGKGDGYGIGSDESYSILDLVDMLGVQTRLTPAKPGNRMNGQLKTKQLKELGWSPKHSLPEYIKEKLSE
jgi:UDP-glucose 4-epimerase